MTTQLDFDHIQKNYGPRLYTLAFRITGDSARAEEALQTAYLNIARSRSPFRGEAALGTWLYTIVTREARRNAARIKRLPLDRFSDENDLTIGECYAHMNSYGETQDEALRNSVKETCLQLFMNCLPIAQRSTFTLRVILGLSSREAASVMNISEAAVDMSLSRARKVIRSFLEERCSLFTADNPCKCAGIGAYARATGDEERLLFAPRILPGKNLTARYAKEVGALVAMAHLFNARFGPDSEQFHESLRRVYENNRLTILGS